MKVSGIKRTKSDKIYDINDSSSKNQKASKLASNKIDPSKLKKFTNLTNSAEELVTRKPLKLKKKSVDLVSSTDDLVTQKPLKLKKKTVDLVKPVEEVPREDKSLKGKKKSDSIINVVEEVAAKKLLKVKKKRSDNVKNSDIKHKSEEESQETSLKKVKGKNSSVLKTKLPEVKTAKKSNNSVTEQASSKQDKQSANKLRGEKSDGNSTKISMKSRIISNKVETAHGVEVPKLTKISGSIGVNSPVEGAPQKATKGKKASSLKQGSSVEETTVQKPTKKPKVIKRPASEMENSDKFEEEKTLKLNKKSKVSNEQASRQLFLKAAKTLTRNTGMARATSMKAARLLLRRKTLQKDKEIHLFKGDDQVIARRRKLESKLANFENPILSQKRQQFKAKCDTLSQFIWRKNHGAVRISNIRATTTRDQLGAELGRHGDVMMLNVVIVHQDQSLRNCAYVFYGRAGEALTAAGAMDSTVVVDKVVRASYLPPRQLRYRMFLTTSDKLQQQE